MEVYQLLSDPHGTTWASLGPFLTCTQHSAYLGQRSVRGLHSRYLGGKPMDVGTWRVVILFPFLVAVVCGGSNSFFSI